MKINGNNTVTWTASDDIALAGNTGDTNKLKGGTVSLNGTPVKKWTIDISNNDLNKNDLEDILILIKYKI